MSITILTTPPQGTLPFADIATPAVEAAPAVLSLTSEEDCETFRALFLDLPKRLYERKHCTQDTKAERAILEGTHPLSTDFTVKAFVAVASTDSVVEPEMPETHETAGRPSDTSGALTALHLTPLQKRTEQWGLTRLDNALARCILTYYPNDPNAYVGFFECVESPKVCAALLETVEEQAKADGKEKLVGPLDASFWVGYRFKTDNYDEHFTGEPNNLPYYTEYWEENGWTVAENYYSNYLRSPTAEDPSEKWEKRLQRALDKGYTISTPTFQTFPEVLKEIYEMLVRLYSTFPAFKFVTEDQFIAMYSSLRYVLDYDCVLLGYKDGKLAGFFVCIPNYSTMVTGDISLLDLPQILKVRKDCKEYVILYIGVDRKHLGLGGAFAQKIREIGQAKGAGSIAALIHEGNSSGVFFRELTTHSAHYVLLEKPLAEREEL